MDDSRGNPLEVCLLLGTETVPDWFVRAVKRVDDAPNIDLSMVVRAEHADDGNDVDLLTDVRRKKSWVVVAGLQKLSEMVFGPPTYSTTHVIESVSCLADLPRLRTAAEPTGDYGYSLPDEDVERIASAADVVVHLGVGILHGRILDAPSNGVLGFHHGDLREYRGGPPGFWEFVHGRSETGVTVQRFTETLDGGPILAFETVDIEDAESWREVRRRQCAVAERMLLPALENLRDPDFDPQPPDEPGPVYSPSQRNWRITLLYLARELLGQTGGVLER